MKADENWKETRVLTSDLEELLGIPKETSEEYLKVLENLIIHKFVEELLDTNSFIEKDCAIELPYLGTLIISVNKGNSISTSFAPRRTFYNKIKEAYSTKQSPLIVQCEDLLRDEYLNNLKE